MAPANHSKYHSFLRMLFSAQSYIKFAQNVVQQFCFAKLISVGLLCFALVYAAQGLQASYGYYLNGQPVTNLAAPGTNAVVLFFVATDCPISNRYIPEIQRIEKKYVTQHVVFTAG
jgi:thiol-disulfide isomerase/thioredoxin